MIRVAFVNQTGAKPGGAEESLTLLLKHLPADIEPRMILFEDGEFAQRMREAGFATRIVSLGSKLRGVTREKPTSAGALGLPAAIGAVAAALRAEHVDLVHTNTVKAHFIGAPAARLAGLPVVMHLRDMVEGMGRLGLRTIARSCSREQIGISHPLADWYRLARTTVIANPVDLSSYTQIPSRDEARAALGIAVDDIPLIGIVGRINRWKGHDRFLRAAAAVNRQFPIRCAIVGEARFRDADFVPELHALAAELGIADRTTFVPWLADPRLAYAALDVHCNCSEREPFGRSIDEAAAAGVPTVAFDDGGAVDIIERGVTGAIVAAGDVDAFAGAIAQLIASAAHRAQMGTAARAASTRFGAPTHAARVTAVLRRGARVTASAAAR